MSEPDRYKKYVHPSLSPDQCARLETFAELIQQQNKIHNLTAVTETEQIYVRHFDDSLAVLRILDAGWVRNPSPTLLDTGSGAGLPAIPLAIALPGWSITSVEATGKKVKFQQLAIDKLKLNNIKIINTRAEEMAHDRTYREQFDVVTARAVSPLNILAELCIPFLKPGGKFIAWKGPDVTDELDKAKNALHVLGAQVNEIRPYCIDRINFNLVVIKKTVRTDKTYPRQYNQIKKSPLE